MPPAVASPVVLLLAAASAVNAAWLAIFVYNVVAGDLQYAFPRGLRSLLAGLLTVRNVDLSLAAVVLYNGALVVGPLVLLAVPALRQWSLSLGRETVGWLRAERWRIAWLITAALVILGLAIFLGDHTRLPFTQERVRWATHWFPLPAPIENPLFVRFQYLLASLFDARYSFVLGNMVFHAVFFAFLVWYLGGTRVLLPAALAYVGVAGHYWFLWYLNGAEAELPAGVFGVMGFLLIARSKFVPGTFALTFALLLKPAGVYYALAAGGLLAWRWLRREADPRQMPWPLVLVSIAVLVPFYVGFVYYVVVLRGGVYIVDRPESPFFVTTFTAFAREFLTVYPIHMILAVAGLLWSRLDRWTLAYLFVSVFLMRSTYTVGGGYYQMMFLPLWALLVAGLLVRFWEWQGLRRWVPVAVVVLVLAVADVGSYLISRDFLTRSTGNWDQLIVKMRTELPQGATVYFRKVSPRYDLVRQGRTDLVFVELKEGEDATKQLTSPSRGALVIAPVFDFEEEGRGLTRLGYTEFAAPFGGAGGFVVYHRRN